MPSGTPVTEQQRESILTLNSILNSDGDCRMSLAEIAVAIGVCDRTVSGVIRRYAAHARIREIRNGKLGNYLDT